MKKININLGQQVANEILTLFGNTIKMKIMDKTNGKNVLVKMVIFHDLFFLYATVQ